MKTMNRTAISVAIGVLSASLALPSHAQTGSDEATTLDEVNVRARRDFETRFASPTTRLTITRRDIEAMGANTIAEVLRNTPGVQVTNTPNGGLEIRMRGMGTQNTRILIDGVPASTSNRNTQIPLEELPAELIERIEVVRAPTAETAGAAGGTLNIVLREASTRRETLIWLSDQYVWGKHSLGYFASQTGPLGKATKDASWGYFLSITGGPRQWGNNTDRERSLSNAGTVTDQSKFDDEFRSRNIPLTITPRINGRIGANDRLTIRGVFTLTDSEGRSRSDSTGTNFTSNPDVERVNQRRTTWETDRSYASLGADWSHSFPNSKWDNTLQFNRWASDYSTQGQFTNVSNPLGSAQNYFSRTDSNFIDNRLELTRIAKTKWSQAFGEKVLLLGVDHEHRKFENQSSSGLSANTVTGVGGSIPAANPLAITPLNSNSTTDVNAAWAQFEMPLEGIKTSAVAGLRGQNYRLHLDSTSGSAHYEKTFFQPSINTRTSINDTTQLRFNLARVGRNPRIWELTANREPNVSGNSINTPDFVGNPNLRPESTITFDTGFDKRFPQFSGQGGLNLFVRKQSNIIGRTLYQDSNGLYVDTPANVGDAMIWGLESDVRGTIRWDGKPTTWNFSANATLLQSKLQGGPADGQRIPGQAKYLANFTVSKPLRVSGGWYGGATLALKGASEFNDANGGAVGNTGQNIQITGRQKGTAQLDFFVGSVFAGLGFWRLNVYNATNYTEDRLRTVTDPVAGTSTTEQFKRRFTPKAFLTVGTRF